MPSPFEHKKHRELWERTLARKDSDEMTLLELVAVEMMCLHERMDEMAKTISTMREESRDPFIAAQRTHWAINHMQEWLRRHMDYSGGWENLIEDTRAERELTHAE